MQRKEAVVGVGIHDGLARSDQLRANAEGKKPPQEKARQCCNDIHHPNTFVVEGDDPRQNALGAIDVVASRLVVDISVGGCDCGHEALS